ncbi:hypothetical protein GF348_24455 [candidate division KSB3 bacterium]|nr:hypothetical protein [candidate division KSB3 bacterium]
MYNSRYLGDLANFPQGAYWPSGTWTKDWSPGHVKNATGVFTAPNPYKDPYLGGIFGDIWGGIKSVGGTVYKAGKAVVTSVPAAAVGMVTGGVPAAIAAGGARAVAQFTAKSPEEQERIRQRIAAEELEGRVPAYDQQYPDSISSAANEVYQQARQEVLRRGGEAIASTPEGQRAIANRVRSDLSEQLKPMLPLLLVGGAAFLFLRK